MSDGIRHAWATWPNRLFIGLFLVATGVQLNDPDPLRWIALYLAAAGASLWASPAARSSRPRARVAPLVVLAAALAWGATLLPDIVGVIRPSDLVLKMSEKGGAVEVGREVGGLAIVALWMAVLVAISRGARPADGGSAPAS